MVIYIWLTVEEDLINLGHLGKLLKQVDSLTMLIYMYLFTKPHDRHRVPMFLFLFCKTTDMFYDEWFVIEDSVCYFPVILFVFCFGLNSWFDNNFKASKLKV